MRFSKETVVTSGSRMKRVLTRAMSRCCTGTHATVRFTKGTFVTSGSRVKRVLTVEQYSMTFNEEEDEDISWRKDLKLNAARC